MREKHVQNYYSKLILCCFLAVFLLVSLITLWLLFSLHTQRTASELKEYDEILTEMEQNYTSIWNDYYKPLSVIYKDYNKEDFRIFSEGEGHGYERELFARNFQRVLTEMCQQDDRIAGVYFKRMSDEFGYVYFPGVQKMSEVPWEPESTEEEETQQRTIIGGRVLSTEKQKTVDIFGIQSQVLTVTGGESQFQITVLYDLSSFDGIMAKYNPRPEARFLVTSRQGMIIYDNWGEYGDNQTSYFTNMDKITAEGDTVSIEEVTYRKNVKSMKKGKYLAFYMVPESAVTRVEFRGTINMVIFVAVGINVVLAFFCFSLNRLIGRKFRELERGIHQIEENNLKYRFPVRRRKDEFTRIEAHFNKMCDKLEITIDQNYVYRVLQRDAEYKALQTSVNPHFLYNSLQVVREKLDAGDKGDESEMILLLSRIFEYQIRGDSVVTIQKELKSLQNYIDFYSIRYQYAFEYRIDFKRDILNYRIPKHVFQPIMENYFVHGFRDDGRDCISIVGYLDEKDDRIHICFRDNGKGIYREQIEKLTASLRESSEDNSHIGLRNVHNRLRIAFGGESGIVIASNEPEPGVSISLVFGKELVWPEG